MSPTLFNIFLELMINEICSIQHTLKLLPDMPTGTTDHTTLITAIFENYRSLQMNWKHSIKSGA